MLKLERLEGRELCSISGAQVGNLLGVVSHNAGAGQSIAIVINGHSPTLQSDFNQFCAANGLPAQTLRIVRPLGPVPDNTGTGWDGEEILDVDMAHAGAPGAKLTVIESPAADYFSMSYCAEAAARVSGIVSMSYGQRSFGAAIDDFTFYANFPKVLFVAATGDTPHTVNIPAADNHVLAVGAAEVKLSPIGQLVGVGVAAFSSSGISDDFGKRRIPDVVGPGGKSAALGLFLHGKFVHEYGASESAPAWAAVAADIGWHGNAIQFRSFLHSNRINLLHPRMGGIGFPIVGKLPHSPLVGVFRHGGFV